jgi:hypothetical protein
MTQKFKYVCLISLVTILAACGGGGGSSSGSGSSNNSGSQQPSGSHNAGQDCMSSGCHDGTDVGERFYAAGTVYGSGTSALANATVRLYISNTNSIAAAMTTDSNGNFYSLDPVGGLFTGNGLVSGTDIEIRGPGGALTTMPGLVTNGSCNSCHGDSVGRINAR